MTRTRNGSVSNASASGNVTSSSPRSGDTHQFLVQDEDKGNCHLCHEYKGCKKWIQCDGCDFWFHTKCIKMDAADHSFIEKTHKKIPGLSWFCDPCKGGQGLAASSGNSIEQAHMKIDTLTKIVETIQQQNMMILKLLEKTGGSIDNQNMVRNNVRGYIAEEKEREDRKNNLIFFNIPESWRGDDNSKQLVNNVCADICPELKDDLEVAEYTRLGKNKPAKITDKPRPVKVTLKSEAPKKVILSRAKALKTHHHSGFQKVVIVPDKTLAERERDKALYLELKKTEKCGSGRCY